MSEPGSVKEFSIELVKEFCEAHFEVFQEWLDQDKGIESSDAEVILRRLGSKGK